MKHLSFLFGMLAIAAILAAIWRPDLAWQCGLTALVFIGAAAGFSTTKQAQK